MTRMDDAELAKLDAAITDAEREIEIPARPPDWVYDGWLSGLTGPGRALLNEARRARAEETRLRRVLERIADGSMLHLARQEARAALAGEHAE